MNKLKYNKQILDAADSASNLQLEDYTKADSTAYRWFRDNRPTYNISKDDVVRLRMFTERLPMCVIEYIKECYH